MSDARAGQSRRLVRVAAATGPGNRVYAVSGQVRPAANSVDSTARGDWTGEVPSPA